MVEYYKTNKGYCYKKTKKYGSIRISLEDYKKAISKNGGNGKKRKNPNSYHNNDSNDNRSSKSSRSNQIPSSSSRQRPPPGLGLRRRLPPPARRTDTYTMTTFDSGSLYEKIKKNILENKEKRNYLYNVYNICVEYDDNKKDIYFKYNYSKWFNTYSGYKKSNHLTFHKDLKRGNSIHLKYWIFSDRGVPIREQSIQYKLIGNNISPLKPPTIDNTQFVLEYSYVWVQLLKFISYQIGINDQNSDNRSIPSADYYNKCHYNKSGYNTIMPPYYYIEKDGLPPSFEKYKKDKKKGNKYYRQYVDRKHVL